MHSSPFEKALRNSGMIHAPLPIPNQGSLEESLAAKEVLQRRCLTTSPLRLLGPCRSDRWPEGAPLDGDYANFGSRSVSLRFEGEDWQCFNRLCFRIRPDCPGLHAPALMAGLVNEGQIPVPDAHFREGFHVCSLTNRAWNTVFWEFPDLPRDRITQLSFTISMNGRDVCSRLDETPTDLAYEIDAIELQLVSLPEPALGWRVAPNRMALSVPGYWTEGRKTALIGNADEQFRLVDTVTGTLVQEGKTSRMDNALGAFREADFSSCHQPGSYRLETETLSSPVFRIDPNPFEASMWKVLNFLYCERCGHPVSGRHGACHHDLTAEHGGLRMTYSGGWHDAGDLSQQTAQTAEITQTLFEAALRLPPDSPLHIRLMEEAEWGLDFVLRTRFGDGYRATSAGVTRWTDGLTGNFDDVPVRVHNHAFLNWLCAGVEAHASMALASRDPELSRHCLAVAKADHAFACSRYAAHGIELPSFYEHTFASGEATHMALASWSASLLYEAGGGDRYAAEARDAADRLLACQETGEIGDADEMTTACQMPSHGGNAHRTDMPGAPAPTASSIHREKGFTGFFYRNAEKTSIVHHNHQSREHLPMQALERLRNTQPQHADRERWEDAMRRYAAYLLALRPATEPWDMLPAGLHRTDEAEDEATFGLMHLLSDYATERANYIEQLATGIPAGQARDGCDLRVRRFPIWFSFRGNLAVHLSQGTAAAILGKQLGNPALLDMARGQLYWLHGKNPFSQSLMFGEGVNFARQYAVLPGEMVGEMPVGIQTKDNQDAPYWPQACNATYKEVWTSAAAHWLRIVAALM